MHKWTTTLHSEVNNMNSHNMKLFKYQYEQSQYTNLLV